MMDLPGFEREDITVTFDGGVLTIAAYHEAAGDDQASMRRETRSVRESLQIPGELNGDAIEATYSNGVLELTLPTVETTDVEHVIDVE